MRVVATNQNTSQSATQNTGFVEVTPQNGAPFPKPNEPDKTGQPLNLSKISQYQFDGDWSSDGAIDIEVSAISFVPPTEATGLLKKTVRHPEKV